MGLPPRKVTISDGGTKVHYLAKQCKLRTDGNFRLIPMCKIVGWEKKRWQLDDGVGADICGRCQRRYDAALEGQKERHKAALRKAYAKDPEKAKARSKAWKAANQRKVRIQNRMLKRKRRAMGLDRKPQPQQEQRAS